LRMLSGEVQGSRKLFWKVVRMECEHLCEEVCCLSQHFRWEYRAVDGCFSIFD
jgi:hypothetical protein